MEGRGGEGDCEEERIRECQASDQTRGEGAETKRGRAGWGGREGGRGETEEEGEGREELACSWGGGGEGMGHMASRQRGERSSARQRARMMLRGYREIQIIIIIIINAPNYDDDFTKTRTSCSYSR